VAIKIAWTPIHSHKLRKRKSSIIAFAKFWRKMAMTSSNEMNKSLVKRSVRFASQLATVLLIDRKDALAIQTMFYDIEDYRRFREEKLLDDLRVKYRQQQHRFSKHKRADLSRRKRNQNAIATSKHHELRPRPNPQGVAQAA
jgi:hypothetical protein